MHISSSSDLGSKGVVLIHPPAISKRYLNTKFMPYGMAVLYAFLKNRSVPVRQHDFLMNYLFDSPEEINYHDPAFSFREEDFSAFIQGRGSHEKLERFVDKYTSFPMNAGIYAFSIIAYHQFWASLLLGSRIRKMNPDALIVFGGPFITIKPPESYVKYETADCWIRGSGELPLLMLYQRLLGEDISLKEIPGIAFIENGEIFQAAKSETPAELEMPPDFTGLDLDDYKYHHPITGKPTLFLPYRITKGCPSKCSFCTGRLVDKYDIKSAEKVVSEIGHLSRKYNTNTFQFADASVNGTPARLSEICDLLAKTLPDIRWYSYAKINGFSKDLLTKTKNAGCFALFWGVESAHEPTIELLGKRFKPDEMFELLDYSISLGIKNYIHLIYNTPFESLQDVKKFKALVNRYISSDHVVFLPQKFLLEPQSLMFTNPEEYGLKNVSLLKSGIFDREKCAYDECGGRRFSELAEANAGHGEMLAYTLDMIQFKNLGSYSWIGKRPVPEILAGLTQICRKHPALERLQKSITRKFLAAYAGPKEQL